MFLVRLKALKALMVLAVIGGVVVGCNDVASVKAPLPAEENTPVAGVVANRNGSAMLTADEREAKKREFFAKPEVKEMSAGLEEIAQAVAVAVEDKTLRDRIYAKCMEKFDGETNVLWQQLDADVNLRSRGGWSKQVDDLVGKGRKNTTIKGIGNVDAAIKKFEKLIDAPLHLFWMYPSKWDGKATPLVAYLPFDADPKTRQSIPAFDSKGNRFELDRKGELAHKRPVLVITHNERTDVNGKLRNFVKASSKDELQGQLPEARTYGNVGSTTRIFLYTASINRSLWTDPDGEWEGSQEFYYRFVCTEFVENTNIWLGKDNGSGWQNNGYSILEQGPGNISLPGHNFQVSDGQAIIVYFTFYEADFLWWDDFIQEHKLVKSTITVEPYPNQYYTYPGSDNKVNAKYAPR